MWALVGNQDRNYARPILGQSAMQLSCHELRERVLPLAAHWRVVWKYLPEKMAVSLWALVGNQGHSHARLSLSH
jgi:hypothetical protein